MSEYVVLGMHRSGTSLMMELLEASGCWLGPRESLLGTSHANPHGYREIADMVTTNDAVLASVASRWFDVLPIIDGELARVDRQEFTRRARRILARVRRQGAWAVKDPRLALVFPLWRDVLDDPTVVLMLRNPVEVAVSLHRLKDDLPLEVGAALWEAYMVLALRSSKGLKRTLVRHKDLLIDAESTVVGLLDWCDDPELTVPDSATFDSIVDPALHRSTNSSVLEDSILTESQRNLFEALDSCSSVEELPEFELSPESRKVLSRYEVGREPATPLATPHKSAEPGHRRTAVIVQGCRLDAFEPSISAIRETWAAENHDDVDVFFTYGNACDDHELVDLEQIVGRRLPGVPDGEVRRFANILAVGCSDLIAHRSDALLQKRLLSLEYLLQRGTYEAFLLVCASSYVDQAVLAEHVQQMPTDMVLQGPTFVAEETGRSIVSGSAMLMSRDLAQRLVDDAGAITSASGYRYADDVSISDWVADHIADTPARTQAERLRAGKPATTDNTFIQPPVNMLDFRVMSNEQHVPVANSYHYHFATDKPETMRAFHKRYFSTEDETSEPDVSDESTIFIQIASYRDSELPRTVASVLAEAEHPERLRFGICWQYDETTFDDLSVHLEDPRFSVDEVYYRKSRGCTWARNRANALFADEDYYLQIDAHMRFAQGWDSTLIEMHSSIEADKPVLTVYPPGYTTDGQGNDVFPAPGPVQVLALESINQRLQTRQCSRVAKNQDVPGPSPFLAAGFLFAAGTFCSDIPYDPEGYFNGEEIALAVRAFTWGYDLFYPSENVIWHRYNHGEPLHWSDHSATMQPAEKRAQQRLATLLVGDASQLGEYGLGPHRTVAEYEAYADLDFEAAAQGEVLPEPEKLRLEIDLDTTGIEPLDDYEMWVFAVMGADERELLRQDIYDPEVLGGESKRVVVEAEFEIKPAKYLLWPKSASQGFGDRRIHSLS